MNAQARELLLKLFARAERAGGLPRLPVTPRYAPEYFTARDPEARAALHAALANAEACGAVALEWGRYEASQDLRRLRLVDAARLADFLGLARAADQAEALQGRLEALLTAAPPWLRQEALAALACWRRGERHHGLEVGQGEDILRLYRALLAVARGEQAGLDLRRFSVRVLGDSKAMEDLKPRFARIWCRAHDLDLTPDELYAELGLEKHPSPVFVRGPLRLRFAGHWLDLTGLRPFLGISPDAVEAVTAIEPAYVLTVENLASYQRHVREVDDRGVVLYCAGFPSPAFRAFLARLAAVIPEATPFFHWGDIDLGGLRIYQRLADVVSPKALHAHLMGQGSAGGRVYTPVEIRGLERVGQGQGPSARLAASWLASGLGPAEQEGLDPVAPA